LTYITLADSDGITRVTIDRPPANAMTVELLDELAVALEQLGAEPPRAIVLAGREGFFSAGVDLKAVPTYGPAEQRRMVEGINRMAIAAYGMPCPLVGAVTGHAIAGGLVLALCCDIRIASTAGRYGLTEVKVGVPYPQAAITSVRAELAPHAARRLALGNALVDAYECVSLGVFDEAASPDTVVSRAHEMASGLGAMPGDVYTRTKRELRDAALEHMQAGAANDPLLQTWVTG
jgi:enoyl-CoA hydratase